MILYGLVRVGLPASVCEHVPRNGHEFVHVRLLRMKIVLHRNWTGSLPEQITVIGCYNSLTGKIAKQIVERFNSDIDVLAVCLSEVIDTYV